MTFYTTEAVALVIGVVATAAETGLSVYGEQQQAKTDTALANYNYAVQKQQAEYSARVAEQQAQWSQQEDQAQAQAQQNNAITLQNQALAQQAQGRAEAEQMRTQNEKQLATLRAHYGAAGVTSEGSPLAVMADTAGLLELGVQQKNYQTQLDSQATQHQAEEENFKSRPFLADARVQQYKSAAADAGLTLGLESARGDLASGLAQAQETENKIPGTIASGVGSIASQVGSGAKSLAKN